MVKTTYAGYVPQLGTLKAGDKILFADKLSFNSKEIQELASQKIIKHFFSKRTKQRLGVEMIKDYVKPGMISPTQAQNQLRNNN